MKPLTVGFDHRRHNHLEQPAHAIVASHRAVVKLIVRKRLPVIARVIGFVTQRNARELRIELSVVPAILYITRSREGTM